MSESAAEQAAPGAGNGKVLAGQYEEARRGILAGGVAASSCRHTVSLVKLRGMAKWLRICSQLPSPKPVELTAHRGPLRGTLRPADGAEIVSVLAGLVLGVAAELRS